jgi:predicted enzyme related to lactoylglutathione lyase
VEPTPTARVELVLDCADPDRLVAFWAPALGYRHAATADNYRALVPVQGHGPRLILQGVNEARRAKNRMHIDILAPDIEAEAARLVTLGATRSRQDAVQEHGTRWIVMADPEGNEFCVCQGDVDGTC